MRVLARCAVGEIVGLRAAFLFELARPQLLASHVMPSALQHSYTLE